MATITVTSNNNTIKDPKEVQEFLKKHGIEYRHWTTTPDVENLLSKQSLNDEEKEELLKGIDNRFQELKSEYGYQTRDLIVLHPDVPGLPDMLAKFDKMHYHTDDEVRYIVDGTGIFGFSINGENFTVQVERNDFISVPKNTHHWFKLDEKMRIKAVRYFIDMSGWTPHYV
ncbi:MAG: cupin domain-containing protein [Leptospira sp.]|nr:cupin domain-containing protein [Leptospira sp.]